MHRVLECLDRVRAECLRADIIAEGYRFKTVPVGDGFASEFPWGYSDEILPKSKKSREKLAQERISLTRDVFLLPDSNVAYDYDLGFRDEFATGRGQVFIAYRLSYDHVTGSGDTEIFNQYSVTVFLEAVKEVWRGTASANPPDGWTEKLEPFGLDRFGERAKRLNAEQARVDIVSLFRCLSACSKEG